jgi:hypothetical protein
MITIAGERLELSRMTGTSRLARAVFIAVAGLLALAAWLARNDIARRTVRSRGVTRYMAIALLTGYCWLAVGGGLWLAVGHMSFTGLSTGDHGSAYDAMVHAIFLGFVISMIFAHASVIVPSVLGRPLPFSPVLCGPLVLLHASLLLRIVGGDAAGNLASWRWGGIVNEVALLLFAGLAASAVIRACPRTREAARTAATRSAV